MKVLRDRTAVVTGGASGIGRALAARFAGEGMNVVVADIDEAAAVATTDELRADGARAIGVATDVASVADVQRLAEATLSAFGAVHVVCNNAGVVRSGRVEDLTDDEWQWVVGVDLWGAIHGVRAFLPLLEKQPEGHIMSTASTSGMVAPPFIAPYSVSKAGVIALMEAVRRELEARNSPVGASVLVPGPVNTALINNSSDGSTRLARTSDSPDGRAFDRHSAATLGAEGRDPDEIAAMVVDGVRANRFWILTHPEWTDVLRRRVNAMASSGMLADRPGLMPRR